MHEENNNNFEPETLILIAVIPVILFSIVGSYFLVSVQGYQNFLDFVYSFAWEKVFSILKVFLILLDFALLISLVYILNAYSRLEPGAPTKKERAAITPQADIRRNWEEIQRLVQSSAPSDWSMAILRADALLDDILRERRTEGANLPERLQTLGSGTIPSIDRVLSAHRLRNKIAHEPLDQYARETINQALVAYEQAFRDLHLLT